MSIDLFFKRRSKFLLGYLCIPDTANPRARDLFFSKYCPTIVTLGIYDRPRPNPKREREMCLLPHCKDGLLTAVQNICMDNNVIKSTRTAEFTVVVIL